ncbi:MAG: phage/plasmid replication domain-containing protein [Ignavibacteria bacterium]
MFDTIGFRFITNEKGFWQDLELVKEITDKSTGMCLNKGKLKNLYVGEIQEGIIINGSLSKYYFGNNLETLTRKTTLQAVESISDELHLKISNSNVYRFDIAQNLLMSDPVKNYLNCLDELKCFKKSIINSKSVYFNSDKTQLVFYDKLSEMSNKRQVIPELYKQYKGRLLRYELRHLRGLKQTFKQDVFMKDLTEERFYTDLFKKWKELYFQISKKHKLKFKDMALKDIKTFETQLMIIALNHLGLDRINDMIELSRNDIGRDNKGRQKISRIKKKIKELKESKELTEQNPLIKELDAKIEMATLYRR